MDRESEAIPFLSLKKSNSPYMEELLDAACRVVESGWYLNGPEIRAFEQELAAATGAACAIGVSNGLDAMRLIFRALMEAGRLRPGDGVMVNANTYIASILPLTEFGLTPVLIEPDTATFGIDWQAALARAENPRAGDPPLRGLLTVHLYGNPSWDETAAERLRSLGCAIVEDNAQAIGASVNGRPTGNLGDAAAFSFYPTKNIGALGDAGAVATDDPALADAVRALANYGSDRRYHNIYRGYNCRLDEIQAAMLRVKLRHLDEITSARQLTAGLYRQLIANPGIKLPAILENSVQVWHQFPILAERRDELREYLQSHGIQTDIHYAVPPHLQPCYAGYFHESLPLTERLADMLVSLPIADMEDDDVRRISETINRFKP